MSPRRRFEPHTTTTCAVDHGCQLPDCVERYRASRRAFYHRRKAGRNIPYEGFREGGIPYLIIDILETYFGRWFTIDQLCDEVQRVRPASNREHVRREIARIAHTGAAETRKRYAEYYRQFPNKHHGTREHRFQVEVIEVRRPDRAYLRPDYHSDYDHLLDETG